MDKETEQQLIAAVVAGDQTAYAGLVEAHSARAIGLAWRLTGDRVEAEDLAQECFLRLYRALPEFRGESRISTWIYRTLTRLAIDHLRRRKLKEKFFFFRRNNDEVDPVDLAVAEGEDPARHVLAGEAGERLNRALTELSPQQRAVFTLRHHEGLPLAEIAGLLGLSSGSVKTHLHRATVNLRKQLADLQGGIG